MVHVSYLLVLASIFTVGFADLDKRVPCTPDLTSIASLVTSLDVAIGVGTRRASIVVGGLICIPELPNRWW